LPFTWSFSPHSITTTITYANKLGTIYD